MSAGRWVATWFGCGLLPKAPGTFGALGALPVAVGLLMATGWPPWVLLLLTAVVTPVGIWASNVVIGETGKKDPQIVVVDEVLGTWLALGCATVWNWKSVLLAFLLFRLFDITKPQPVRWLESLGGGTGIVADDLMAGVYAGIVLFLAGWFNLY